MLTQTMHPHRSGWVSTAAGSHLKGRRKRDTAPERALRSALHTRGLRFRLQRRLAKGCTPDLVLPRFRVAVFVDGCFWHSCPEHGRTSFSGPNAELWRTKLLANRRRDERSTRLAQEAGWTVIRVWECAVNRDLQGAATRVEDACRAALGPSSGAASSQPESRTASATRRASSGGTLLPS